MMELYKIYFLILNGCIAYVFGSCGITQFNDPEGTISSPTSYPRGQSCVYKIEQPSIFMSFIKLSWRRFEIDGEMPSCNKDYLEVYAGLVSHHIQL